MSSPQVQVSDWSAIVPCLIIKGSALPADPKIQKNKHYEKYKNENLQKLIILEGFMQNGLQNRNQRIFLRRKWCVKIDFQHFLKNYDFWPWYVNFLTLESLWFSGFEALGLCSNDFAKWKASDFISQTQNRYQKV